MATIYRCMDDFTPEELARLADYFAQELPPGDMILVEHWINENPERVRLVNALRLVRPLSVGAGGISDLLALDRRVALLARDFERIRGYDRIQHHSPSLMNSGVASIGGLSSTGRNSDQVSKTPTASLLRSRWYALSGIAASALLVLMGWQLATKSSDDLVSQNLVSTYTTGNAERATVTLPDGSKILLNVDSRLEVPSDFVSGNRVVHLEGQAYFTVSPKVSSSFTVVSGPSVTRVLGTRFGVRYYGNDSIATVSVEDGKVSVGSMEHNSASGPTAVVTANQTAFVSIEGKPRVVSGDSRQLGFARGVLEFDDSKFPDAIPELNRWYNVDIRLGDSALLDQQVWGTFEAGAISDLVSILEVTFQVRVVRDGKILTLYKKR